MSSMTLSGSPHRRVGGQAEVTPPEVRDEVRRRLEALEDTVGVRSRDVDTAEVCADDRYVEAEVVADTISRLRLLEMTVRNRERLR